MRRHTGPARFRGIEGADAAELRDEGRKVLGALIGRLELSGAKVGTAKRVLADGTVLIAHTDGVVPTVIALRPSTTEPAEDDNALRLWVPTGFVVYPASDAHPLGWGTPVQQDLDDGRTPYSIENRAPGLDVMRWTPGGALGQVLITQQRNAGYPRSNALEVPLLFSRTRGLRLTEPFTPAETVGWAAYRIEFADFSAQFPGATADQQADARADKRTVFELVNEHRVSMGRHPLLLPVRGYYDGAQTMTEIQIATATMAHFSDRYPATYCTPADRIGKDGFHASLQRLQASSRNRGGPFGENVVATGDLTEIGTDPNGVGIFRIDTPGPALDGASAFDAWLDSPPHKANLESTAWNGHCASTTVGIRAHVATQQFYHHEQWVECGNRFWNSKHAEIPTLSWFGFASLNLTWETWPMVFAFSPSTPPADPLIVLTDLDIDGLGQFWLHYWHGKLSAPALPPFSSDAIQPALDTGIYLRGRSIALAPRGGWVWASAIQKHAVLVAGAAQVVYRLVALVHHVEDQPDDNKANGMTRYLRVWWCDLPDGLGLPANPQSTIRGVYGEEDEGYPWDVVNSPYSWRGGDLLDVGRSAGADVDLLKYASQWVFNSEGTKAACLRDLGTYDDYGSLWAPQAAYFVRVPNGLVPTALELSIDWLTGDAPALVLDWKGVAPGTTERLYGVFPDQQPNIRIVNTPRAVGYDADDRLTYCMDTHVIDTDAGSVPGRIGETSTLIGSFLFTTNYDFAPQFVDDAGIPYTTSWARNYYADVPTADRVTVLDVRDRVVMSYGFIQPWRQDVHSTPLERNAAFTPCWLNTAQPVVKVCAWRDGQLLHGRTFANPDMLLPAWGSLCWVRDGDFADYYAGTQLPLSATAPIVPSYAVDRAGNWMLGYHLTPQPVANFVMQSVLDDCAYSDFELCRPTLGAGLDYLLPDVCATRGGWFTASFLPAEQGLADLVGNPDTHPRFFYARAV